MSLAIPAVVPSPLARAHPVFKLAAAAVLGIAAFAAGDALTSGVLLVATLLALPFTRLGPAALLRRIWPLLVIAFFAVFVNIVFAQSHPGADLLELGPLQISTGSLLAALVTGLRVVAVVFPATLAVATMDPTDLADALVQQLHAPARFAYGALAALRLIPLLFEEWQTIVMARRARGVDSGGNPVTAVRLFGRAAFILLVGAVRRATRMAEAMDARGFDQQAKRSVARPQPVRSSDVLLLLGAVLLAGLATAASLAAGTWAPPLG